VTVVQEGASLVTQHRIRHALAILAALLGSLAWAGTSTPLTAAAAVNGCSGSQTCRWTQWYNGNWSPGNGSPSCNPCVHWPLDGSDFGDGYWNGWYRQNNWEEHETDWAVNYWNSLQYNSPVFDEINQCGCASQLQYQSTSLQAGVCGWTTSNADSNNIVTSATVYLGTNVNYTDGPNNQGICDVRHVLLHETGHVMAEGHSSMAGDLMYGGYNQIEAIDQDAQSMLAAVYGTYAGGCDSGYCGGNADIAIPAPIYLNHLTAAQIEQAVVGKTVAATKSVEAEQKDANNIKASAWNQVPKPTFCGSICDPPPGGVAPSNP
jgi:hypothetical protein